MTSIRSLDIHPNERWTPGRVALHVAHVTPAAGRKPPRLTLWKATLWIAVTPTIFVFSFIFAWRLLRWGLL